MCLYLFKHFLTLNPFLLSHSYFCCHISFFWVLLYYNAHAGWKFNTNGMWWTSLYLPKVLLLCRATISSSHMATDLSGVFASKHLTLGFLIKIFCQDEYVQVLFRLDEAWRRKAVSGNLGVAHVRLGKRWASYCIKSLVCGRGRKTMKWRGTRCSMGPCSWQPTL